MAESTEPNKLNFLWLKYNDSDHQISYLKDFLNIKKNCHLNAKELSYLNLEEFNLFFEEEKYTESNRDEAKETQSINEESNDQPSQITKDLAIPDNQSSKFVNEQQTKINGKDQEKKNQSIYDVTNNQLRTIVKFGNIGIHYQYYSKKKKNEKAFNEEDKNFIDDEEDQGARGLYFMETQYDDYFGFSGKPEELIQTASYQKRIKDLQKMFFKLFLSIEQQTNIDK